jgi:hypothetical protein
MGGLFCCSHNLYNGNSVGARPSFRKINQRNSGETLNLIKEQMSDLTEQQKHNNHEKHKINCRYDAVCIHLHIKFMQKRADHR